MKRYIILVVGIISMFTSCSLGNDDTQDFFFEVMSIQTVDIPEEFVQGETYEISVTYNRPNSCYEFNDFIYRVNGNERTVAVVNTVYTDEVCDELSESVTVSFDFLAIGTQTYVFKFYQGEDDQGIDQYLIVEVPVVE